MRRYASLDLLLRDAGKTALTIRFLLNRFAESYDPAIEGNFSSQYDYCLDSTYRKECMIDDDAVALEVLDTSGLEGFQTLLEEWARLADGFMLVYSITSRSSFEEIWNIRRQILDVESELLLDGRRPMVLVGNNNDRQNEREVSLEGRGTRNVANYRRAIISDVI
jgi:GTPase KRas